MSRYKATATITFHVDADDQSAALELAAQVAADLEPERAIRYRHQPIEAIAISVSPIPTTEQPEGPTR